jgi:hypothetical protein
VARRGVAGDPEADRLAFTATTPRQAEAFSIAGLDPGHEFARSIEVGTHDERIRFHQLPAVAAIALRPVVTNGSRFLTGMSRLPTGTPKNQ